MATKLDTLSAAVQGKDKDRAFAPIEPARDTDVAGFLKNERENAILAVIEETRRDTFENAERLHWESTLSEQCFDESETSPHRQTRDYTRSTLGCLAWACPLPQHFSAHRSH